MILIKKKTLTKPNDEITRSLSALIGIISLISQVASRPIDGEKTSQNWPILSMSEATTTPTIATSQFEQRTPSTSEWSNLITSERAADMDETEAEQQVGKSRRRGLGKSLKASAGGPTDHHDNSKFDHRDYVVSDLEFELVLGRLGLEHNSNHLNQQAKQDNNEADELQTAASSDDHFGSSECFICLEEFESFETNNMPKQSIDGQQTGQSDAQSKRRPITRLLCRHEFHSDCIASWLRAGQPTSQRCPICMNLMKRFNDGKLLQ